MTIAVARRRLVLAGQGPLRRFLFFGQFVAAGFLAIAISGAICLGLSHAFGEHAIAGDSQSAYLSPARCADLLAGYPSSGNCSAAELAHHTDEIVSYRLAMALPAALALIGYEVLRRVWGLAQDERREQRGWHLAIGLVAFGLAALVLLSMGFANVARGSSAGTARWLSDGSVALGFFAVYAALRWRGFRAGQDPLLH